MVFRIDKKVLRLGIEWNRKTQRCLTAREGRRGEGRKKQVNFKAGIVACKNKKGNSAYSDDMVELATQKKAEPIIIAGESASKPKGPPTPA